MGQAEPRQAGSALGQPEFMATAPAVTPLIPGTCCCSGAGGCAWGPICTNNANKAFGRRTPAGGETPWLRMSSWPRKDRMPRAQDGSLRHLLALGMRGQEASGSWKRAHLAVLHPQTLPETVRRRGGWWKISTRLLRNPASRKSLHPSVMSWESINVKN